MPPGTRSIGQVLKILKDDFPDVTISKIRFLEAEGLVSPERAPSGYRRYSETDVRRLRSILDVQKNHYLPLTLIRENLQLMANGEDPPSPVAPAPEAAPLPAPVPTVAAVGKPPTHLTRQEPLRLPARTAGATR